jgi:hypothetical protein
MPSKFEIVGTLPSLHRLLESIKYQAAALDLMTGGESTQRGRRAG